MEKRFVYAWGTGKEEVGNQMGVWCAGLFCLQLGRSRDCSCTLPSVARSRKEERWKKTLNFFDEGLHPNVVSKTSSLCFETDC